MNGIELPCGKVLRVEPADSSYGNKGDSRSTGNTNDDKKVTGTKEAEQSVSPTKKTAPDVEQQTGSEAFENDDLDDFFSSL